MRRARGVGAVARPTRSGTARVLGDDELVAALRVCAADPVASILAAARIEEAAAGGLAGSGGHVWGYFRDEALAAVCWSGANIVPVGSDPDAIAAFAELALREGRRSSSVVGESSAVMAFWEHVRGHWSPAREVRPDQPSLVIDGPPGVAPDPAVRHGTPEDFDVLLPACVAMFTEEVGYSPVLGGGSAYARRVRQLIDTGRSFVRMESGAGRPEVTFKAELGAVALGVAQVQGVWVDPAHRGRRLSESGMAAVVEQTRREVAPVVSLYVNAYNGRALAAYTRVGFRQVGTYATILF